MILKVIFTDFYKFYINNCVTTPTLLDFEGFILWLLLL